MRRAPDGSLSDVDTGAAVTIAELRDDLQGGRYFRATRSGTGLDCTNELLAELIQSVVPAMEGPVPASQPHPLLSLLAQTMLPRDDDVRR